jgi:hypothetical protein
MIKMNEYKILQCDGSIKIYNERQWWMDGTIGGGMSFGAHHVQKKAEKISNIMSQIQEINRQTYLDSLLKIGVVRRANEKGVVTMRDVEGKLAR